jgi:hypothetical protein
MIGSRDYAPARGATTAPPPPVREFFSVGGGSLLIVNLLLGPPAGHRRSQGPGGPAYGHATTGSIARPLGPPAPRRRCFP